MNFKKLIPLFFLARSLFPTSTCSQNLDLGVLPKTEIEFSDGNGNFNSFLDLSLDEQKKQGDLMFTFNGERAEHKAGLDFLMNKDPVWNTINSGARYELDWKPVSFLEQELKIYAGYQDISSVKIPFLYHTGQFFAGGKESMGFILGGKDGPQLEAKGILGGYLSILNEGLIWDNYRAGYRASGSFPISFFSLSAWFSQMCTHFNKDKYFFVDSSEEINVGGSLRLDLEELILDAFFNKKYCFGKELNDEKICTGANLFFREVGVNLRGSAEMSQLYPELSDFEFGIGKTVFGNKAYAEVSFGLFMNKPSLELRLGISPGNSDAERIVIKAPSRRVLPLIGEQGYEKPGESFDDAIKKTDTLAKIGNVGNYFPYGKGEDSVRSPEQFFKDGYGDCDEIAWYRTYAARQSGYKDSWFVGYADYSQNRGHAFFLVKDKDGRAYVTDNDHGVWLKLEVDKDASKEEMAKSAVEQLSRYMSLAISDGDEYAFFLFDENGKTPIYYEDKLKFNSKSPTNIPIDTGLMSKIGSSLFY